MPTEEHKDKPDNKVNDSGNEKTPIPEQQPIPPGTKSIEANPADHKQESKPEICPNVIVNVTKEENTGILREAIRANKYTRIAIIISTLLFLLTLATFWVTKRSVNISEQALSDSRKKDSILDERNKASFDLAKKQYDAGRVSDSLSEDLSKQSVTTQVSSLNQAEENFEIQRRPVLCFFGVRFDSIPDFRQRRKKRMGVMVMKNYGITPAFITIMRTGGVYKNAGDSMGIPTYQKTGTVTSIAAPYIEIPVTADAPEITADKTIQMNERKIFLYYYAEIQYTDVLKKHLYKSTCCFKCSSAFDIISMEYFVHPYNKMTEITNGKKEKKSD